jgi:hypothetical protein
MIALFLYLALPFLCILAIPATEDSDSRVEQLVFGIALYESLVLITGIVLGVAHLLTSRNYTLVTGGIALALLTRAWRNGIPPASMRAGRWLRTRRGAAAWLLAAVLAVCYALQLFFDASCGTRHFDGLWYHIPRVVFWLQHQGFAAWETPVWAQVGLPVAADVVLGHKILLGLGWRGTGYVTLFLSTGAIAVVYLATIDLGLKKWQAFMTAILFGSFPAIGMRIWSLNSDMAAAFPILASYVALRRIGDTRISLACFIFLNGMAIACKPTVAPHALLLGGIAIWQCRQRVSAQYKYALPLAAGLLAAFLVIASYWPIYLAYADFQGGDIGRAHKTTSITECIQALSFSTVHWALEPLGYLAPLPGVDPWIKGMANSVYTFFGAQFDSLPESWRPWPSQDVSQTGLIAVFMIPVLLAGLPVSVRKPAILLCLAGYVPLNSMVHFQPWNSRYAIVFLAAYSILWVSPRYFRRGNFRWVLICLVALNIFALLGVTVIRYHVDKVIKSRPGGAYFYLSREDRQVIANSLSGRPLQLITYVSLDALLPGPEMAFPLSYIVFPKGGDWQLLLSNASRTSNWLAVVHGGMNSVQVPDRPLPEINGFQNVALPMIEKSLIDTGWHLYRRNHLVAVWQFIGSDTP